MRTAGFACPTAGWPCLAAGHLPLWRPSLASGMSIFLPPPWRLLIAASPGASSKPPHFCPSFLSSLAYLSSCLRLGAC